MRSSAGRIDKYSKKLRALVLPGQTARYAPTAADRIHLEYCVKKEAITPMLQFSYVAFLEELIKHEANKRPEEATGIYNKWLNRGLDATTLQSVASCIGVSIEIPAPPVCDWSWKRKLTFSGNVSATDLDDFPILVHLTNANFDFNKAQALGQDIRFMDSDTCPSDGTPLKHEIEFWDKPGASAWVWVKVPRIDGGSVNDFIYMFYGNGVVADGQDSPNVWTKSYGGVYHLKTNNPTSDSTANGYHGVRNGTPVNVACRIYHGTEHDGTGDFFDIGNHPEFEAGNGNTKITVEGWFKARSNHDSTLASKTGPGYNIGWWMYWAPGDVKFQWVIFTAGGVFFVKPPLTSPFGSWYHVVGTYDGETLRIFIDGDEKNSNPVPTGAIINYDGPAFIGTMPGPLNDIDGYLDEVRISYDCKTPDWIKADYLSQTETLITYGAEEAAE